MTEAKQIATNRPSHQRTNLAVMRTLMAADRTLMAWTRTALSMITFGFTVYKFMEYLHEQGKTGLIRTEQGAQNFGMTLIGVGVLSLLIAWVQYWNLTRKIDPGRKWHFSMAVVVAGFIVALGFLALVNAIFRIGPF